MISYAAQDVIYLPLLFAYIMKGYISIDHCIYQNGEWIDHEFYAIILKESGKALNYAQINLYITPV
jgi:hypothetical protein